MHCVRVHSLVIEVGLGLTHISRPNWCDVTIPTADCISVGEIGFSFELGLLAA